ncbi:MAG: hypothetical protein AAF337_00635 [Pseudomonadota bacterium]
MLQAGLGRNRILLAIMCIAAIALPAGCTQPSATGAQQPSQDGRSNQYVATLLAQGEAAASTSPPNLAELAQIVRALEQAGARPQSESEDPVETWRALAQEQLGAYPPFRGRLLGPTYQRLSLKAGAAFELEQLFLAGQNAVVSTTTVEDGVTSSLTIRSSNGDIICESQGEKLTSCEWVPLFTARYRIEIRHDGPSDAALFLTIN